MKLERGTVVRVSLDPALGHEQHGARPCVVVSDPAVLDDQRYPMLCVVPLSGTPGVGALYPRLEPGESGIRKPSTALVDQLRAVDKRRIIEVFGVVDPEEMASIDEAIALFLGMP